MGQKILITGATGNVGFEVVKLLAQNNSFAVIAGVRNPEKSKKHLPEVELRALNFEYEATFAGALEGIDKIFLVRPPQISNVKKHIFPFLDLAKQNGVQHIVFLSLLGVEKNFVIPHHKIEKYLLKLKIPYTFLRAGFFMQNLNTTHRVEIAEENEIFLPAGNGKTSFIDVRDIAAVAALALSEKGHENKAYDLTGKEALDYYEVADIFSRVLGRRISYQNPGLLEFYRKMRDKGVASGFILLMIMLYGTTKYGLAGRVEDDVQKLLRRAPISFKRYVEDYKNFF